MTYREVYEIPRSGSEFTEHPGNLIGEAADVHQGLSIVIVKFKKGLSVWIHNLLTPEALPIRRIKHHRLRIRSSEPYQ